MNDLTLNTAIILCGGRSRRMGFDKQTITIDGQLIALHIASLIRDLFDEIILVTNRPKLYVGCPYKVVRDRVNGFGPLAGIHAGLSECIGSHAYVVACDMPLIDIGYIKYMRDRIISNPQTRVLVTKDKEGHTEPFNSFYAKALISDIEDAFAHDVRKIIDIYEPDTTMYTYYETAVCFSPNWAMFSNMNTVKDMKRFMNDGREIGCHEINHSGGLL